ncbi:MAG: Hsp20/alpha crystallin family protein [Deltaproteobacteria bacterium]|nr:MAG: Hsp20/alpha crystallin family protein [Deltaproteobacteria bacterium]
MSDKELQVRGKQEAPADREQTRPGPVFMPAVDIFESGDVITLLADVPGVSSDRINIDVREDQLTITAEIDPQKSEEERYLLHEYETGMYQRAFSLSDRVDQSKISATMKDGVLRLDLPKAEKAKPRRIEVKTD